MPWNSIVPHSLVPQEADRSWEIRNTALSRFGSYVDVGMIFLHYLSKRQIFWIAIYLSIWIINVRKQCTEAFYAHLCRFSRFVYCRCSTWPDCLNVGNNLMVCHAIIFTCVLYLFISSRYRIIMITWILCLLPFDYVQTNPIFKAILVIH